MIKTCISWIIDVVKGMAKPESRGFEQKEVRELEHADFLRQWRESGQPQLRRDAVFGWMDSVTYHLWFEHNGKTYKTFLYSVAGVTPDADPELLEIWEKAMSDNS